MSVNIVQTKKCGGCKGVAAGPAWPTWAKLLRSLRSEADRGVGDTAERLFGLFGTDTFRAWHVEVFGSPCAAQCPKEWNSKYGYNNLALSKPNQDT